ncbi:ATP-binding protein [Candidatus Saccharibacteria bacterium]|nr:ATP-binding protein [Candidatus Saccharibacteria bacterium]
MMVLIFIAISLLVLAGIIGPIFYIQSRKVLREQKNYERGLKMVPLLIHLPPSSEDKESGARDEREIIDENVSKAQILYTIIASTLRKGFRNKFYGQRHFAFEIVATHGFVRFYAAVPVAMIDVVTQAVISAYPSAQLEEVPEHNIFSPVGKITGTVGGELTLKEPFAYPIATYQDLKRDPMQTLLNSLSSLEKGDGVGIQLLMRPAESSWRKQASAIASKKRKGKEGKKGGQKAFDLLQALWKPPEAKEEGSSGSKDLSGLDQSILDSIDDKTRHAGYETLIRVVSSSNVTSKAQAGLNNVVAAFALFDSQGRNGFKYTPAKDIEQFVTAYILRFFPQESNQNILNAVELASIFHFPDQKNIPTSQLERQASKQVDAPRNIPSEGLFLGYNLFRGVKKPIRISLNDRQRHMYAVGQTGTGKSTFLENLALQDMLNGDGFCFIDPHGDTAERLLAMVPKERTEDVIYFCPADMEYPMGLNLFEFNLPEQKDFLIQEAINMLYKLYDPQHQGIIGPRYEHWFRNAALTVMGNPEGGTFIDIPKVFTDKAYERELRKYITDQTVLDFWNKEMAQTSDYHKSEVLGWFVSKFGAFLSNEMMRNIIGQTKSAFDLREIMDNRKILLVNLSKGRTGELNSKLLGMIFVMKFQAAAMSRANIPEEQRVDFGLYVDEFQNFSTDSFATIMSEARKYHLNLIVANQFTTQLTEEIRDAVFGNMGTIVSFRVGQNDVDVLSKYFQPLFEPDDLLRVPNHNAIVRTLVGGVPTQPFSMSTVPPLGTPNPKLAQALKQLSAAKYGKPKAKAEAEIFGRLATKEPVRPAGGSSPYVPQAQGGARPGAQRPRPGTGSFLDEWLAKRRQTPAAAGPAGAIPSRRNASTGTVPTSPHTAMPPAGAQTPYAAPHVSSASIPPNPVSTAPQAVPMAPQASSARHSAHHTPLVDPNKSTAQVEYNAGGSSTQQASGQFDQEEVATIAEKLKNNIGGKPAQTVKNTATSGEVSLRGAGAASADDTIIIDKEGNLHYTNEEQSAANQG